MIKILLIDDSEDIHTIIRLYLKNTPAVLVCASSADEGVEKYQAEFFDLVILDVKMPPGRNGFQAARNLRAVEFKEKRKATKLYILTALNVEENLPQAMSSGCDGALGKPILKENFLKIVNEVIEKSS